VGLFDQLSRHSCEKVSLHKSGLMVGPDYGLHALPTGSAAMAVRRAMVVAMRGRVVTAVRRRMPRRRLELLLEVLDAAAVALDNLLDVGDAVKIHLELIELA
jgi:hypothetical protein